jgi:DNA-binding MarR family transcriptional regulator
MTKVPRPRRAKPVRSPSAPVPLARLMAMGFRQLIDGLHLRLADRGYVDIPRSYGFVLLACRNESITAQQIAELLGITKQGTSQLVESMLEAGYISAAPHPKDARVRWLKVAPKGRDLLSAVESIYEELENEWAKAIGRRRYAQMHKTIQDALLFQYEGQLPPVKPTW